CNVIWLLLCNLVRKKLQMKKFQKKGMSGFKQVIVEAISLLLFIAPSFSQPFNLFTTSPSDKLAKSNLYYVDDEMNINIFSVNCYSQPSSLVAGSIYDVPATKENVSSVNNYSGAVAGSFSLEQNFPNPFNPSTEIRYQISKGSDVSLKVYDAVGREVSTLVNEWKPSGTYEVTFNGSSLASGTYFYRLIATNDGGETHTETKRLTLLK
ncbi:MAG: T9SS type A sorting domain-containing protein, partial [Bacteroidota bacterium]|nr:T9SS type A sorting domain-containing protein [Bacteroidota bacterium]